MRKSHDQGGHGLDDLRKVEEVVPGRGHHTGSSQ
jgi:hypothetical protein